MKLPDIKIIDKPWRDWQDYRHIKIEIVPLDKKEIKYYDYLLKEEEYNKFLLIINDNSYKAALLNIGSEKESIRTFSRWKINYNIRYEKE